MRILAIAPTSFYADYGCHVRIRGHLSALRMHGHDVHLVTYPSGRDVDGIPTTRVPWLWPGPVQVGSSRLKIVLDGLLAPTALAVALGFRPHLVHAYLHEGALIGWIISTLMRRPLVFDFQGSLTGEMLDHRFLSLHSLWFPVLSRLERWIDQRPDAILVSSAHAGGLLAGAFGVAADRVTTLPDSVDSEHFRPAAVFDRAELAALRNHLGIPADGRIIVYLGLLAPYQGTDMLLQAMVSVVERHHDVHLLLMGFPFVARYRARAAAFGLSDRVTLTGAVPYEAAPAYLALGEVAIAPKLSATEGSGKLLTYMAAGLPVVATDIPVHHEYLGDLGFYASAHDPQALAAAVSESLVDPVESMRRGQVLRARASQCYGWKTAVDTIEAAYKAVLKGHGAVL